MSQATDTEKKSGKAMLSGAKLSPPIIDWYKWLCEATTVMRQRLAPELLAYANASPAHELRDTRTLEFHAGRQLGKTDSLREFVRATDKAIFFYPKMKQYVDDRGERLNYFPNIKDVLRKVIEHQYEYLIMVNPTPLQRTQVERLFVADKTVFAQKFMVIIES